MKRITEYIATNGIRFTIVKKDEHFLGIEEKYIDESGRLKTALTGKDMYVSIDLEQCLDRIEKTIVMNKYMAIGWDAIAAVELAYGASEEHALEMSAKARMLGLI